MKTQEGGSKGFGFVTMMNDDEATRAVSKLNHSTLKGREIEVRFKLRKV